MPAPLCRARECGGAWTVTLAGRSSFLTALLALLAVKILLAGVVPPFGDEVFYWQESRELATGYSDLPPLTAWLIRAGCILFGDTLIGLRFAFVLCGVATIAVLFDWWRARWPQERGLAAWAAAVPLLVLSGQLATADAPLTLAFVVAARALDRGLDSNQWRHWLLFALAIAIAWMCHWRAAMLYPVGLLLLMISPRAQVAARGRRFWIAQLLGATGLLRTLWFNAQHDWDALRFQAVERHAWQFDVMALLQPLEQALTVGVLLYPLLLWTMWQAWRRRREPGFDVIAAMSIGIAGSYFVLGLFADAERTRFHWPLPAYLPLLLLLPSLTGGWAHAWRAQLLRGARMAGYATALGIAAVLVSFRFAGDRWPPGGDRRIGEPFLGWQQVATETAARLAQLPADTVLVADNFLLAAQLDFALDGARPVYVLDHPRNTKHGRQKQLALWRRDQAALMTLRAPHLLIVVEENALYASETLPFYRALCADFPGAAVVAEHALFRTAKRFVWLEAGAAQSSPCRLPALGHLDTPTEGQRVVRGEGFVLSGWVVRESQGIDQFEVRIDGTVDAQASAAYGAPATYVRDQWPELQDARWPHVGFYQRDAGRDLAPGNHRLELRARVDSVWRLIAVREIYVE